MQSTVLRQRIYTTFVIVSLATVQGLSSIVDERLAEDAVGWRLHAHEALVSIGKLNERKADPESLIREYQVRGDESLATSAAGRPR